MCLTKPMYLKKMMEHADNCVGPLSCVTCLIKEVIDLPWDSFTTYPKNSTLPRGEEVNGARLERVGRIVHLLGHIKGVVHN